VSVQDNVLLKAQGDSITNLKIVYFGFGNAFGVTRISCGGHYTRLPYLFTPSWNTKQWAYILFWNFACMVVPAALLVFAASELEAWNVWRKTHNTPPESPAEKEQFVAIRAAIRKNFFKKEVSLSDLNFTRLSEISETMFQDAKKVEALYVEASFEKSLLGKVSVNVMCFCVGVSMCFCVERVNVLV
jgi:hypothetical protein